MKKYLVSLSALAALAAHAPATVLYQTDFENFSNGDITGQSAWESDTDGSDFLVGPGGKSGKGVSFDTDPALTSWAWKPLSFTPNATTGRYVEASVDVSGGSFAPGASGSTTSRFGIDIYNGAGSRIAGVSLGFSGGTTTQATFNTLIGTLVSTNVTAAANSWHNVKISLDTVANSASFYLDGALMSSRAYTANDATIGDADLYANATGYDIGKFDNLSVQAVPEPGTMAALGLGLAAVARRRRARR